MKNKKIFSEGVLYHLDPSFYFRIGRCICFAGESVSESVNAIPKKDTDLAKELDAKLRAASMTHSIYYSLEAGTFTIRGNTEIAAKQVNVNLKTRNVEPIDYMELVSFLKKYDNGKERTINLKNLPVVTKKKKEKVVVVKYKSPIKGDSIVDQILEKRTKALADGKIDKNELQVLEDLLDTYEQEAGKEKTRIRAETYKLLLECEVNKWVSRELAVDTQFQKDLDSLVEEKKHNRVLVRDRSGETVVLYFINSAISFYVAKYLEKSSEEERFNTVDKFLKNEMPEDVWNFIYQENSVIGKTMESRPVKDGPTYKELAYKGFMKQSDFYFKHTNGIISQNCLLKKYFEEAVGRVNVEDLFKSLQEQEFTIDGREKDNTTLANMEITRDLEIQYDISKIVKISLSDKQKETVEPVDIQAELNKKKLSLKSFLETTEGKAASLLYNKVLGRDIPDDVLQHFVSGTWGGVEGWQKLSLKEFREDIDTALRNPNVSEKNTRLLRRIKDTTTVLDMTYPDSMLRDDTRRGKMENAFYNKNGVNKFKSFPGGLFDDLKEDTFDALNYLDQDKFNGILQGSDLYAFRIDSDRAGSKQEYILPTEGGLFAQGTKYRGENYKPRMKDISEQTKLLENYINKNGTEEQKTALKEGRVKASDICSAYALELPTCENPAIAFKFKECFTTKTETGSLPLSPEGQLLYGFGYEVRHGKLKGRKFLDFIGSLPAAGLTALRDADNRKRANNDILDVSGYWVDVSKKGKAEMIYYKGDKMYGKEKFELGYGLHDVLKTLNVLDKYVGMGGGNYGANVSLMTLVAGLERGGRKEKKAARVLKAFFPRIGKRNEKGDIEGTDQIYNRFENTIIPSANLKVIDAHNILTKLSKETEKAQADMVITPNGNWIVHNIEELKKNPTAMLSVRDTESKLTHFLSTTELTTIESLKDFKAMKLASLLLDDGEKEPADNDREGWEKLLNKFNAILGGANKGKGAAFPPKLREELERNNGVAIIPLPFTKNRKALGLIIIGTTIRVLWPTPSPQVPCPLPNNVLNGTEIVTP